jgi:hypothetical protein
MAQCEVEYKFELHLSAEEYLQYYQGVVQSVQVRSQCGKRIQFSADKLRPFVMPDGIHGTFIVQLGAKNKFLGISRIWSTCK